MAVEMHPTENQAVIGGMDNMISMYDISPNLPKGQKKAELGGEAMKGHDGYIASLKFNTYDTTKLVSAGGDGDVILWDYKQRKVVQKFWGHVGDANCIRFPKTISAPSNQMMMTCSSDKTVRVWDLRSSANPGKSVFTFEGPSDSCEFNGCSWFPNGTAVAGCCENGEAFLWDLRVGAQLQAFKRKGSRVCACDFSASGRIFYCAYEDGHVGLWDAFGSSGIKQKVQANLGNDDRKDNIVKELAVSADGTCFATGDYSAKIKVFA